MACKNLLGISSSGNTPNYDIQVAKALETTQKGAWKNRISTLLLSTAALAVAVPAMASSDSPVIFPSGLSAGVEYSWLKTYNSENFGDTSTSYNPAKAFWVRYQAENGLGVRLRSWEYNVVLEGGGNSFEMRTVDTEVTQAFVLGSLEGLVSGGVRFGKFVEPNDLTLPSAIGLVGALELKRNLVGGLSAFGSLRQSIMIDGDASDNGGSARNIAFATTEMRLGLEYNQQLVEGGPVVYGRIAAVAHRWANVQDGDTETVTLFGGAAEIGLRFGGDTPLNAPLISKAGYANSVVYPSGLMTGVEYSWLKAYNSEAELGDTSTKFDPSMLYWVGYQGDSGLGVRGRWWKYSAVLEGGNNSFEMQTTDLELTQAFNLGPLEGLVSGGVRLAKYEERFDFSLPSAIGLVAGLELKRNLVGGLSAFGSLRQSIMVDDDASDNGGPARNIAFATTEMRLGLEYNQQLGEGGPVVYGRIAAVANRWSDLQDGDTETTTLFGGAAEIGLRFGGDTPLNAPLISKAGYANSVVYPSGLMAGIEYSWLQAYNSEANLGDTSTKFDPAILYWVGYQGDSGLGVRGRWWKYNAVLEGGSNSFEMQTTDLELTQTFNLGSLEGLVSGGVRLAKFEERNDLSLPSAIGLVAGLELKRNLVGGLSIYGSARHAIMVDDDTLDNGVGPRTNGTFAITEARAGLEYKYTFMENSSIYGRIGAVANRWDNPQDEDTETITLFGGAAELGVQIMF